VDFDVESLIGRKLLDAVCDDSRYNTPEESQARQEWGYRCSHGTCLNHEECAEKWILVSLQLDVERRQLQEGALLGTGEG
jgi:hypothetical protein